MAELLNFTKPHLLRNEDEYNAAVGEIERLLDADPQPDTDEHERLAFLSVLVEAYEDSQISTVDQVTPQQIVDFMLEQKGLTRADLGKWLGGERGTAEFFEGVRGLSVPEIESLRTHLGIPADLLIRRDVTANQEHPPPQTA